MLAVFSQLFIKDYLNPLWHYRVLVCNSFSRKWQMEQSGSESGWRSGRGSEETTARQRQRPAINVAFLLHSLTKF